MLIHPELKSELRQLGLDENTVPDAETWKKLLATIGSVYDQRDSAQTCFNALFEQNNDAIFLLNLEGKHLLVNQQASEMLGYKHNEIIGLSVQDMVVEREHHLSEKVRQTLAAGKKMPIYERTFRHKNGHEIPTEVNVDLVRDSAGRPLYIQSVVRNITQRKANAEKLRQSEERFRTLIQYIPIGILLQGPHAEMLLSNPKALEVLDLTEDQLLGKTSFDPDWNVIHEDGSPFPGETHPVPQAIAARKPIHNVVMGVYRPTIKDRVWLLVNAEPLLNSDGVVQQVICTFNDITKLKQAEAALRDRENQLRQIMDSISDLVVYFLNDFVEYVNPAVKSLLGYQPENWIGRPALEWIALVHPDDRQRVIDARREAIQTGTKNHLEYRIQHNSGQYRWFETFSVPVSQEHSRTQRLAVSRDITESKEAQDALRESENRYRVLWAEAERQRQELELLSEIRTIIGHEMNIGALIRTIVTTIAEKFGYSHTSLYLLRGETLVLQYYVGYDRVIHEIPISTAVSGRVVRNRKPELVVNASEDQDFVEVIGSTRSMVCVPLFKGGDVAGVYMIESPDKVLTEDDLRLLTALGEHISLALERAQLYTDLEESKLRYQTVVDNIHDVIFQLDTDGRWTFLNPAWEDTTGYPVESSLGQLFTTFIHPEDAAEGSQRFKQLVSHQLDYSRRRVRYLHRDGRILWIEVRVWPLVDIDGTPMGVSGTLTDISSQLQAEEQSLEMASQARTVEALKYFLGGVSHDLRTPLSVLNTSAYLIRRKLDQPDKLVHHLDVVEEEIARLSTMVEDMMEMSKVDEEIIKFQFVSTRLNEVVDSVILFTTTAVQLKHQHLTFVPDTTIPAFKADSDLLHSAIKKLIQNAIQYTPDGGQIIVRTGLANNMVRLEVRDNGPGIEANHIPHIFDRFYKVDQARTSGRGGVGLGLAFVKKIVEAHGGQVMVESVVGEGSTFTIALPLPPVNA